MISELFHTIGFDDEDAALLARLAPVLRPRFSAIADAFCEAARNDPEARARSAERAPVEEQRERLLAWLEEVVGGSYDAAHVAARLDRTPLRFDVEQRLVLGAMSTVRAGLHRALDEADLAPAERARASRAVDVVCDLELAVVLESFRARDLERTAASRELARSATLHRAVFDTVEELIVGLDREHRIRLWNRSAAETTGWSAAEAIGQSACELLLDEGQRAALDRSLSGALEGTPSETRVRIRTRSGAERVVHWQLRRLSPEGSGDAMVLMAGNDVTETLELERRAAEAEAMAAMGRLTSSLAHEIRNPLNAAKLQLELLRRSARKLDDAKASEALSKRADVVRDEIGRLSKLLDDFMGLARPKHLAMAPFDVGALVREVAATQRPIAEEASIELEVAVEGEPLTGYGDAGRLRQALVDLIANALDAVREQGAGHVRLCAGPDGPERVELRVEDDGPGLAKPGDEVLRPFVTTKKAGTGLGLPIVQKIAELHGGSLDLGPREGGGTRAVLTLRRPRAGDTVEGGEPS
jgi:PAS domain S-box-containing protein